MFWKGKRRFHACITPKNHSKTLLSVAGWKQVKRL